MKLTLLHSRYFCFPLKYVELCSAVPLGYLQAIWFFWILLLGYIRQVYPAYRYSFPTSEVRSFWVLCPVCHEIVFLAWLVGTALFLVFNYLGCPHTLLLWQFLDSTESSSYWEVGGGRSAGLCRSLGFCLCRTLFSNILFCELCLSSPNYQLQILNSGCLPSFYLALCSLLCGLETLYTHQLFTGWKVTHLDQKQRCVLQDEISSSQFFSHGAFYPEESQYR